MATLMGMQKETKLVLFLMAFVLYLLGPGQETILAVDQPDLIMTDVSPSAGTVNAGATLLVNNTVQNQGALSAGSFKIDYRLSTNTVYGDGDDVVITTGSVKSLAAGISNTAATSLKIPKTAAGSYHVCAMADSAGKVIESNEANNTFCSASQVTVPRPDLIMTDVNPTAGTVNAGDTLLVGNTVKNQGALSSGGFGIVFHLSTDAVYGGGDDVVISGARSVKSLAVGATDTATTGLKIPKTAAGSYYVCAMADSAGKVIEDEETNNSRCTAAPIMVSGNTPPDDNGTLLFSIDSDQGHIFWHKIVVDEDGDAMALWDVANTSSNISSVWASYYEHMSGQWGQAHKISGDDVVTYFSLPEAKFDQNGGFIVANTGIKVSGSSTWWNRFDPATGWGTQRSLLDGREAFGLNTRGEIFSQRPDNKEIARYDTNTDTLTPDFIASLNLGVGLPSTATFSNLNGGLLEAHADFGITAADVVVSLFSYSPVGGWSPQFNTPVLTFSGSTGTVPLETAIAEGGGGHIAVVVVGKYCPCNVTNHWFVAAIYFDGTFWGDWKLLDGSTEADGVSAPSVKIDDEGRALVIWAKKTSTPTIVQKLRAAAYSPGSGWGTATNLNTGSLITSGPNYPGNYTPEDAFTMSGSGDAVVSWMDIVQSTGYRIRENRFHPATGWAGETLVRLFPIATTAGGHTPKAQVNSTGKGFRTWIRLSVDPKTYPHTLISTDELRAEPIITDDSPPTTTTTLTTTTSTTTTTTTTTTRSTTTTTTAGTAGVDIDVTLATPASGNTNISGTGATVATSSDTLNNVPVTRVQVDATTNGYKRQVVVYFETATGNVVAVSYSWGLATIFENSVYCPSAGCTGVSVNKVTKVITFVNTALDNNSPAPPPDKFATLNGSIQYQ